MKYHNDILNTLAQGHNHWSVHWPKCPFCEDHHDHWHHHLICPYPLRCERTWTALDKILLEMRQLTTALDLYQQIKYGLLSWLTQLDDTPCDSRPDLEHAQQQQIG